MAEPRDPLADALRGVLAPIVRAAVAEAMEVQGQAQPQAPAPALLTAKQLCDQLQISRQTLNELQHAGMPRVLVQSAPRYVLTDVIAWLSSRAQRE